MKISVRDCDILAPVLLSVPLWKWGDGASASGSACLYIDNPYRDIMKHRRPFFDLPTAERTHHA